MTPQEKAKGLYNKYATALFEGTFVKKNKIKQCALIAINEMLEYTKEEVFPMGNVMPKYDYDYYLEEVKEELEKL